MAEFAKLVESLYEAALQGDESLLQDLLLRDPLLLHRPLPASSNTPPLHLACKRGHATFVSKVLHRHPNLAEEFNPNDKSTLLHLAARSGHLELVMLLVSINPDLCYVRDMLGQTPVHLAAIKGKADVLEVLLRSAPGAARERVGVSLETVLHLCVKFQQLEALMRTVKMVGDAHMMNATDVMGNTILHIAVATKNLEIVEFLLRDTKLKKDSQNSNGLTAMDIFEATIQDGSNNDNEDRLRSALKREKVFASKDRLKELKKEKRSKWIDNQGSTLMIVASLIATMAFQAGLNPPGGVWQDDKDGHSAGESVWASTNRGSYDTFFKWNTAGFVLSMGSIVILISGLPFKIFFLVLIKVTMWFAVAATAFSYGYSTFHINGDSSDKEVEVLVFFVLSWIGVMGLLFIGHLIQWPVRCFKYLRKHH